MKTLPYILYNFSGKRSQKWGNGNAITIYARTTCKIQLDTVDRVANIGQNEQK